MMKIKTKSLVLFGVAIQGLLYGEEGYTNSIQMLELGAGDDAPLLWDMPGTIADEGANVLVGQPVPSSGALFILSTIQAEPFNDWFIDQAAVGVLANAAITLTTHDDTVAQGGIPMTRADQPISVEVAVSGLFDSQEELGSLSEEFRRAVTEVRLDVYSEAYAAGKSFLPGGDVTSDAHTELALVGNGNFPKPNDDGEIWSPITGLNPSAPDKGRGEEHFVVRSLSGGVEGIVLDQAHVQVWPVWSGRQSGLVGSSLVAYDHSDELPAIHYQELTKLKPDDDFDPSSEDFVPTPGEVIYKLRPPDVTFTWDDLYPTSSVALIVNDASIPYPWGGRLIGGSRRHFNKDQSFSHSQTIRAADWDKIFDGSGRYAVWMVTETPGIGWEIAGKAGWVMPLEVPVISVRASIQSLK